MESAFRQQHPIRLAIDALGSLAREQARVIRSRIERRVFGNIGSAVMLFNRIVRNAHMFLG